MLQKYSKYQRYLTLAELLIMIDEPNRTACQKILADNRDLFQTVPGSTHNHQAWPGGYIDHVTDAMNIAVTLYAPLNVRRPAPFSLSDVLLVLFLHDLEKPWKYEVGPDGDLQHRAGLETKVAHQEFRMQKLSSYGVRLTPDQENGLKYAEGELNDYTNRRRVMGPLAALCHACDVISARLWFDHPKEISDLWLGSRRMRS